MPELPFSRDALFICFNMMTMWFLLPVVARPVWRLSWFHLANVLMFGINLGVTIINFTHWLALR